MFTSTEDMHMNVRININRQRAMGYFHNCASPEQALKKIRHEHSNYDNLLKSNNWDQVRREFSIAMADIMGGNNKLAVRFYLIMKNA